jgi:hypothetical protein
MKVLGSLKKAAQGEKRSYAKEAKEALIKSAHNHFKPQLKSPT